MFSTKHLIFPIIWIIIAGLSLLGLFLRRNCHPIRARPFRTSFLCQICIAIWILIEIYELIRDFEILGRCYISVAKFMLLSFIISCYNAQGWVLWFQYKRTTEITDYSLFQTTDTTSTPRVVSTPVRADTPRPSSLYHWFSLPVNRKYKSEKFLTWILLGLVFIEGIVFVTVFFSTQHKSDNCGLDAVGWAFKGFVFLSAFVLCIVTYKTRVVQEVFYLRSELIVFCILGILVTAVRIITEQLDSDVAFYVGHIAVCVLGVLGFINGTILPMCKSWRSVSDQKYSDGLGSRSATSSDFQYSLDAVLQDSTLKRCFRTHLCEEFSVENLMFIEFVEEFERTIQKLEKEKHKDKILAPAKVALSIYFRFITEKSTCTVNLKGTVVDAISQSLQQSLPDFPLSELEEKESVDNTEIFAALKELPVMSIDKNIYADAKRDIFKLLQSDTFPRFVAKIRKQNVLVGAEAAPSREMHIMISKQDTTRSDSSEVEF